jgi:hypothetical protein
MRGHSVRVPVQRGRQQLRKARKEDQATTGSARPAFRGISRKDPTAERLRTARAHLLYLWNDSNDYFIEIASVSSIKSSDYL